MDPDLPPPYALDEPPAEEDIAALLGLIATEVEDTADAAAVGRALSVPAEVERRFLLGAIRSYAGWVAAGRPFSIAWPIVDVATTLRRQGYPVGVIGNLAHLTAVPPEDHTPFSATGWPNMDPEWWVFAFDVMPPPAGSGLPDLATLAAQMIADKVGGVAGMAWLKYANWTPHGAGCRHDSFQPGHVVRPSSDVGHNHYSGRTDYRLSRVARDYDPVARIRAAVHPAPAPRPPTVPKWPGRVLVAHTGATMMHGTDVQQWQQQMHHRRYPIKVDGWYGAASASVCRDFQRYCSAHGTRLTVDGKVGPATWRATWAGPK